MPLRRAKDVAAATSAPRAAADEEANRPSVHADARERRVIHNYVLVDETNTFLEQLHRSIARLSPRKTRSR
jgi:hypothetical protein